MKKYGENGDEFHCLEAYFQTPQICPWMTKADMTSDSKVEKNAKNFLTQ